MNTTYKIIGLLSLSLMAIPFELLAQGPGAPPATPIDGGLSILLAAGGAYGIKKIAELRKDR